MQTKRPQAIVNVNVVTEEGLIRDVGVLIEDRKIVSVGPIIGSNDNVDVFDGSGMTLVPGFIDLHVHGGSGFDFMDLSTEAAQQICRFHASHGTTGLLATTMTAALDLTEKVIRFYNGLTVEGGATILGLHLEGPFINREYKGAQNGEWIAQPSLENVSRLFHADDFGIIKLITFAPELVEDPQVFSFLQRKGVIMSLGHSGAGYDEGCSCYQKGVCHATHLGNAMRGFHHRDVGIVGLVMEQPAMTFDLIADGVHLFSAFIRRLVSICSPDQVMLVTDAMRATGLSEGEYELGGQKVLVREGQARLEDGVLAGSVLTLECALANVIRFTGMPLEKAICFLTINPARKLGVDRAKGSIKEGKDADLVLLDQSLQVQATWVEGKLVFHRENDK